MILLFPTACITTPRPNGRHSVLLRTRHVGGAGWQERDPIARPMGKASWKAVCIWKQDKLSLYAPPPTPHAVADKVWAHPTRWGKETESYLTCCSLKYFTHLGPCLLLARPVYSMRPGRGIWRFLYINPLQGSPLHHQQAAWGKGGR